MTHPIDVLSQEHDHVLTFLDVLERAVRLLHQGVRLPPVLFTAAARFAREYVDGYHHHKEERLTFEHLASVHDPTLRGLLDRLEQEHDRGRRYVTLILESLPGYDRGGADDTAALTTAVQAFCVLLRHHVATEEDVFFPLARDYLTSDEVDLLWSGYRACDERYGARVIDDLVGLVPEMERLLHEASPSRLPAVEGVDSPPPGA